MKKDQNDEFRSTVWSKIVSLVEQGVSIEEIKAAVSCIEEELESGDRLHDTKIPIIERIRTFDDAVNYLGIDNVFVKDYEGVLSAFGGDAPKDILAYARLRIITAALNEEPEGWKVKYGDHGDRRWVPYFSVLAFGGPATSGTNAGLAYAYACNGFTYAAAYCGSRLCYKDEKLARYSGEQFMSIWEDFILK